MQKILTYTALVAMLCLMACTQRPKSPSPTGKQPDIYPDYVGVTIPVGIAPLNFAMADDNYDVIDVVVEGSEKGSIHANGKYADFDLDEWRQLLEDNKGGKLTIAVCARRNGEWEQFLNFFIHVSPHPLGAWGLTYRKIPPSYKIYSKMGIYERDLSSFDEHPLLVNTQAPGMCINCHTANRTQPTEYVFHVRGEHGATVIHRNGKDELLQARNDSLGGSMVYPSWHPGGRYCAFSTNKTSQMFHNAGNKRVEVYDSSSDIFVYDTEKHEILSDSIVMRKYWAENCPAFSHDGKWLYFVTAKRQVYPTDYDKERYSLCRVAFDEGSGTLSDQVDTLVNCEKTGKSATWPRPSYDGKYIMYTQADYGYFSIWHPESDLWLYDLATGETHPLEKANSQQAESLHSWTANSHWFLFTSRRGDGLYSKVYLAAIDNDGNATKPFLLPQRNPKKYYTQTVYSFNTPDFTSRSVKANGRKMGRNIESDQRTNTTVNDKNLFKSNHQEEK